MCPEFIVDEDNCRAFRALVLYFTNDSRFEEEGFGTLSKGIFLAGNVGSGKTLLLKSFLNSVAPGLFAIKSTKELNRLYQKGGVQEIEPYCVPYKYSGDFFDESPICCFDDIGAEAQYVKYMGNDMCVMEEIIMARYEFGPSRFARTFFTSNFSGLKIGEIYGSRVGSRLREMQNFIVLGGNDRRK